MKKEQTRAEKRAALRAVVKLRMTVHTCGVQMVRMQRALLDVGLAATAARINMASVKLGWEAAKAIERAERREKKWQR